MATGGIDKMTGRKNIVTLAGINLAISNSITNQVDSVQTLDAQISYFIRSKDRSEIAKRLTEIKRAYNRYGLAVSNSISLRNQEMARSNLVYPDNRQPSGA